MGWLERAAFPTPFRSAKFPAPPRITRRGGLPLAEYEYKGFTGVWAFDYGTKRFHGEIEMDRGRITFTGSTPEEVIRQMESAVENYLRSCDHADVEPSQSSDPEES